MTTTPQTDPRPAQVVQAQNLLDAVEPELYSDILEYLVHSNPGALMHAIDFLIHG